ncbi:MAG: hypothetical protein ACOX5F_01775 [Anaerovoracaceae bacterium]
MYRNRFCNCDECKRDILDDIEKGICNIRQGIKDIQTGLDLICCTRIREGIACVERGLCRVEKGLCEVLDGLTDYEFECDYRNNMCIRKGICDLKDGVRGVSQGLCELKKCCLCEGIVDIRKGLKDLEQGLCNLVAGVDEIRSERARRWRNKCAEIMPDIC